MGFLRRFVSAIVLVIAIVILVGICMNYPWGTFTELFKSFTFTKLVNALIAFMTVAGNAIILIMLGFIGITIPGRAK